MNEWYSQDTALIAKQNDERIHREAAQRSQLHMAKPVSRATVGWAQRTIGWAGSMLVSAGMSLQRAAR